MESKPQCVNDTMLLKQIIDRISKCESKLFNINEICGTYGIKRRLLYDFLSISSIFNVCQKINNESFIWNGLTGIEATLDHIRAGLEHEAKIRSMVEIFDCTTTASIQNIAVCVIKLFLYLGVKFLDLREVGRLFCQRKIKYKTMLRKLYTVASSLETAGIISRTAVVAEMKLNMGVTVKDTKKMGVMSILCTESELAREQIYERRRKEYNKVLLEMTSPTQVMPLRVKGPVFAPLPSMIPVAALW